MSAPFKPGDRAVFMAEADHGIRVRRATVLAVEPKNGLWAVETTAGTELVDDRGEGAQLVPLDAEIESLLAQHGDPYVLGSERDEEARSRQLREREARDREIGAQRDTQRDAGR